MPMRTPAQVVAASRLCTPISRTNKVRNGSTNANPANTTNTIAVLT